MSLVRVITHLLFLRVPDEEQQTYLSSQVCLPHVSQRSARRAMPRTRDFPQGGRDYSADQ